MVKNVIKGSFPMSKVLVFEGNSFVRGKNDSYFKSFSLLRVRATYVEKMKILDYFVIAHGKECD